MVNYTPHLHILAVVLQDVHLPLDAHVIHVLRLAGGWLV